MQKQNNRDELRKAFKTRIYRYILKLIQFLFLNQLSNSPILREIKNQLTRSGISIGANYFEAEAASSKRDYQNFSAYSLKSANESRFWLSVLLASALIPQNLLSEDNSYYKKPRNWLIFFASGIITM